MMLWQTSPHCLAICTYHILYISYYYVLHNKKIIPAIFVAFENALLTIIVDIMSNRFHFFTPSLRSSWFCPHSRLFSCHHWRYRNFKLNCPLFRESLYRLYSSNPSMIKHEVVDFFLLDQGCWITDSSDFATIVSQCHRSQANITDPY